ncbi:ATP-dependent helicase upf1 [Astathelohania contejeani]|uniref:ATP-dependent helicase upf1 n=1 Tax=Astathelohania contejeani TaxID=164912 RepID=A0ABQ7I1D4_9MICR|nr:ATP-dependent helicase upf1 [Thelohania contejeani]
MNCCFYCHTTSELVQCVECNDTFCNSKHLVHHLVRKRHLRIYVGKYILQCSRCSSTNVFNMGFYEDRQIICRECDINDKTWKPVIQEKAIVSWLLNKDEVVVEEIQEKVKEESEPDEIVKLPHTKFSYKNFKEYKKIFLALIKHERDEEKKLKLSIRQEKVVVKWLKHETKLKCSFIVDGIEMDYRMSLGDEMELVHSSGKKANAFVVDIKGVEVSMELKKWEEGINDHRGYFTITHIWRDIGYERMISALGRIREGCKETIFNAILGNKTKHKKMMDKIDNINKIIIYPPNLPILNDSQRKALIAALTQDLTLIQGPPGTGKTITSAIIAYNISKIFKGKVLVVSPSNTAVDHLTSKLAKTGLNVLRVVGRSRESIPSSVDDLSLHVAVSKKFPNADNLDVRKKSKVIKLKKKLITDADVITCTCVTAGKKLLQTGQFPFVIIDEAGTCTEPLNLIPLVNGCKKLILVGDQKQLGPTLINHLALRKAGYGISLFERFIERGWIPHMLNVQYRMHPLLCEFPANTFYSGLIKNGISISDRITFIGLPMPTFFYACLSGEEIGPTGTSYLNPGEGIICEDLIARMEAHGIQPEQIGVITPYECQRSHLIHRLGPSIEVASVDAFQGREKDFIIVSFVRSSHHQSLGFVDDPRRLNVTLTRARYGLILIGNPFTLCRSKLINKLIQFYNRKKLIYKGSLDNLKGISLNEEDTKESVEANGIFDFKAISQALYKS